MTREGVHESTRRHYYRQSQQKLVSVHINFKECKHLDEIIRVTNQPVRLYSTVIPNKFGNISNITSASIEFGTTIDKTIFYTHKAVQVFTDYFRPFYKSVYTTTDAQPFLNISTSPTITR